MTGRGDRVGGTAPDAAASQPPPPACTLPPTPAGPGGKAAWFDKAVRVGADPHVLQLWPADHPTARTWSACQRASAGNAPVERLSVPLGTRRGPDGRRHVPCRRRPPAGAGEHAEMSKTEKRRGLLLDRYYLAVHVSDEDPWLHLSSDARPPKPRNQSMWRWLVGIILILILVCGGAYLAVNIWIGHGLDKARESDGQPVGRVRGFASVSARQAGAQHVVTP